MNAEQSHAPTGVQNEIPAEFLEESRYWLMVISSWKKVTNSIVAKSGTISASAEITAEVARTAGELSLLSDRLALLHKEVEFYNRRVFKQVEQQFGCDADLHTVHDGYLAKVKDQGEMFRNLVSEMVLLETAAYKRFLS